MTQSCFNLAAIDDAEASKSTCPAKSVEVATEQVQMTQSQLHVKHWDDLTMAQLVCKGALWLWST